MKRIIALAIMLTCALSAETKLTFIIQSNSSLCAVMKEYPYCPPEDMWKAGIMAMAANDDPAVVAYLFTVTAKLKDGTPFTGTELSAKWPAPTPYTAAVIWIGKEPSDFTDVRVTVEPLRKEGSKVEAVTPGIEAVAKAEPVWPIVFLPSNDYWELKNAGLWLMAEAELLTPKFLPWPLGSGDYCECHHSATTVWPGEFDERRKFDREPPVWFDARPFEVNPEWINQL